LAAWRRMSRSVASSVCSTMSSAFSVSNAATRARRAPSSASGVPARAAVVLAFGPTETRAPGLHPHRVRTRRSEMAMIFSMGHPSRPADRATDGAG
jgi:hypothetical protein